MICLLAFGCKLGIYIDINLELLTFLYLCPFFFQDELLWGNAWLYRATKNATYLNFINTLGANDMADIFSWDNKFAGARVLLSRVRTK